jgi:hypothetical protein
MPATRISLAQVRVASPCPASWDEMTGDDAARFCEHCQKHVHNLSALREDEAQRLICESAGSLCIAYVPDEQGAPTTLAYAPQRRPRYGWRLVAMIAALGGAASAFATVLYRPTPPPAAAPMMKGKMMLGAMVAPSPANSPTTCPVTGPSGT